MVSENSPKVLLIYPPNQLMDVETPRPDGSLGPLYLASSLEARGIETDVLDASVGTPSQRLEDTFYRNIHQGKGLTRIGMDFDEIAKYVLTEGYTVVGISSNFTPQTNMAMGTARAIKKTNPEIQVYAGGINARALKERFLATSYFDGICLTEGELIFPRIVLDGVENTPGIAFNFQGKIQVNPVTSLCFPKKLDDLPMPAWEKLPFDKYDEIISPHGVDVTNDKHKRYAPMMTSRGCIFSCTYCHISQEKSLGSQTGEIGKYRTHSLERVVKEVDKLKSLGVGKIFFEDDSLLVGKGRIKQIFKIIADRDMSIMDTNGVNIAHFYNKRAPLTSGQFQIDREYIEILRNAGFEQVVFPIESGSKRILKKYATNKIDLDRMNLPLLMKTLSDIGIKAPLNVMIGFPDETEDEMNQSIDLARELMDSGAPYVTFFIPIPFPGSVLYNYAIEHNHLDSEFDTDIMNWKRPVMKNTTVPPERLREIADKANESLNTDTHLKNRLEQSVGHRWRSNNP